MDALRSEIDNLLLDSLFLGCVGSIPVWENRDEVSCVLEIVRGFKLVVFLCDPHDSAMIVPTCCLLGIWL